MIKYFWARYCFILQREQIELGQELSSESLVSVLPPSDKPDNCIGWANNRITRIANVFVSLSYKYAITGPTLVGNIDSRMIPFFNWYRVSAVDTVRYVLNCTASYSQPTSLIPIVLYPDPHMDTLRQYISQWNCK